MEEVLLARSRGTKGLEGEYMREYMSDMVDGLVGFRFHVTAYKIMLHHFCININDTND